jgi:hypothetical protein
MILSSNLLNDFKAFHLNQEIAKIIQPNQQCGFPISGGGLEQPYRSPILPAPVTQAG